MTSYDLKDVKLPVLSGAPLTFTTTIESQRQSVGPKLIKDAGILLLGEICLDEAPTNFPNTSSPPHQIYLQLM